MNYWYWYDKIIGLYAPKGNGNQATLIANEKSIIYLMEFDYGMDNTHAYIIGRKLRCCNYQCMICLQIIMIRLLFNSSLLCISYQEKGSKSSKHPITFDYEFVMFQSVLFGIILCEVLVNG